MIGASQNCDLERKLYFDQMKKLVVNVPVRPRTTNLYKNSKPPKESVFKSKFQIFSLKHQLCLKYAADIIFDHLAAAGFYAAIVQF